ncbi:MAG TPA: AbrB/MazE/SpoVT family DNA-binding domain-containing protein [Candidatus Methylacidiphilales bacterium]|jgi:AbrB family looped-hinge helix DNA binding protein|nr:AbrB/MazE/SpoVT family DNA-binding domain-containing protein [Candidatus Methylacidiphilales bacterium]
MQVSGALNIVTFTTKGQVVIPSRLRKEFDIKMGTRAAVISTPEGILLKPVTREYICSLRGSLKNKKVWDVFQEDRCWERER